MAIESHLSDILHYSVTWKEVSSCSLIPCGLWSTRLLCRWYFPGKNTGVGWHFILQGIFLTQESSLHLLWLLPWQVNFLRACHLGSPKSKILGLYSCCCCHLPVWNHAFWMLPIQLHAHGWYGYTRLNIPHLLHLGFPALVPFTCCHFAAENTFISSTLGA